jgi:hypothetical protein
MACPENVGNRSKAHGRPRMTTLGPLDGVGRQKANRVDRASVQIPGLNDVLRHRAAVALKRGPLLSCGRKPKTVWDESMVASKSRSHAALRRRAHTELGGTRTKDEA